MMALICVQKLLNFPKELNYRTDSYTSVPINNLMYLVYVHNAFQGQQG